MAQKKISQLTAAEALAGTEVFAVVQGGATDGGSIEQIREYVASQPNVFSVTQTIESAAPALRFSENDTVDQNWEFIGVAGALRVDELNDAFSNTGTHHTFTHGGGTQFGSPTGGDQGAGTVNSTGLYVNGDPVLQDSDLAANGGTVTEDNRTNFFNATQDFLSTGTVNLRRPDADGSQSHVFDVDSADLSSGNMFFRFARGTSTTGNIRFVFHVGDGTSTSWFNADSGSGVLVGGPAGGFQGAGTINAEAVYDDGTLLTDYVFDAEIDGAVDADAYDAATPDREYKDDEGRVLKTETRKHAPARKFSSELDELDPASFEQKWRATRKLPAVARLERDKPSIGELSQALLETCEVQAVHIAKLEARIAALEASK